MDQLEFQRQWKTPTTKNTNACCLYGALERLPQYTNLPAIRLNEESEWKDAMSTMVGATAGHSPMRSEVTKEALQRAVLKGSSPAATLLLCSWATSGRPWNMYAVKREDVTLTPMAADKTPAKAGETPTGYRFMVTFRDHKTVKKIGAYTTHSWLPPQLAGIVLKHLGESTHQYVFPKVQWHDIINEVKDLLKEQDEDYTLKSLRRGCLSTQARSGVPIEVVQRAAQHKNVAQTLRYLSSGKAAGAYADQGETAAKTLFDAVLPTKNTSTVA
jgi:hypothetical protein